MAEQGIVLAVVLSAIVYGLVVSVATLAIRPRVRNWLDRGKIEFIELGSNDRGSKRFLAKANHEGFQPKGGPFVKLEAAYVYVDRDTNRRRVIYNGDTGSPIRAREGEGHDEVDGMVYAAALGSKDVERIQQSHGGIPWVQLAMIGGLVLCVVVIGALWVMKALVQAQGA